MTNLSNRLAFIAAKVSAAHLKCRASDKPLLGVTPITLWE